MSAPSTVHWTRWIDGVRGREMVGEDVARLITPCPFCHRAAITMLPSWELAKQADGTTAVCNPALGGCNHGFAVSQ